MKRETAVSAALSRAGYNTDEARLRQIVHAAITKHHGNKERALKTAFADLNGDEALIRELLRFYVERFEGLPANGHASSASHSTTAYGRQTDPAGAGQRIAATPIVGARPGREPTHAERKASGAVAKVIAITILDTYKVRDGRSIGDVRYGELDRLRATNAAEASVIRQILHHCTAPHDARVRDVVDVKNLQLMIQRAAEVADAG